MWSQFFIAALAGALFLFVPGYLLLRACRLARLAAFGAAPAVSVAGYQVWAIVMAKAGIWASWASVSLPVLAVAAAALLASVLVARRRGEGAGGFSAASRWLPSGRVQAAALSSFLLFSVVVVGFVFVKNLDGPASYFQAYDNLSHMLRIKVSLETGWFAPVGLDLYYDLGGASPVVSHSSGFYPSGWHCIAELMVGLLGVPVALAENATNALFMGLVFPAAACFALCVLFRDRGWAVPFLCVLVLAFADYPWGILNFGPLYPNLAAYAMLPAVAALFALALASGMDGRSRLAVAFAFLVAALGMALTHPNAVFVAYVFLVPFVAYKVFTWTRASRRFGGRRWTAALAAVLFLVLALLLWYAAYRAPAFAGVVGYKNWWAFMSKHDALRHFLLLSLHETPAQPVLALLVVLGCLYTLRHRKYFWLTCSYGLSAVMYAVNVTSDGFLKNFLTGFWYEDSYRICAMAALFGLPLACLGLAAVLDLVHGAGKDGGPMRGRRGRHVQETAEGSGCSGHGLGSSDMRDGRPSSAGNRRTACAVAVACVVAACIYCPNLALPGGGRLETAFGYVGDATAYRNDASRLDDALNADERAFLQEVKRVVPEGALVLNHPYDGSSFAFANEDLRVYYRVLGIYNGSSQESDTSKVIRNGLCNIAADSQVREAVDSTGAEYLLMLDQGNLDSEDHRRYLISYHPENWPGIESIDDSTPGFEVVLAEGDMRLYRIVG